MWGFICHPPDSKRKDSQRPAGPPDLLFPQPARAIIVGNRSNRADLHAPAADGLLPISPYTTRGHLSDFCPWLPNFAFRLLTLLPMGRLRGFQYAVDEPQAWLTLQCRY